MFYFSRTLCLGSILALSFLFTDSQQLSAYVSLPRSVADTTDRMNAGGDPPDRAGLRDDQRSPEYVDDWWGRNDYHYSEYGMRKTGTVVNPYYDTLYHLPNTYYPPDSSSYYNDGRYYRPGYPR
jgi:hypothetical protein